MIGNLEPSASNLEFAELLKNDVIELI